MDTTTYSGMENCFRCKELISNKPYWIRLCPKCGHIAGKINREIIEIEAEILKSDWNCHNCGLKREILNFPQDYLELEKFLAMLRKKQSPQEFKLYGAL